MNFFHKIVITFCNTDIYFNTDLISGKNQFCGTLYKPQNLKYGKPLSCNLLHIALESMFEKYSIKAPKANVSTLCQFCSLSEQEIFLSLLNTQF